jgi:hypothetical protein
MIDFYVEKILFLQFINFITLSNPSQRQHLNPYYFFSCQSNDNLKALILQVWVEETTFL